MLKKLSYSLLLFIVFSGVVLQGCATKTPKDPEDPGGDGDIEGKIEMSKDEAQLSSKYSLITGGGKVFTYNDPESWDKVYEFNGINSNNKVYMVNVVTENAKLVGKKYSIFFYSEDWKELRRSIQSVFEVKISNYINAFLSWEEVRDAGNVRVVLTFTLNGVDYFTQLPMVNISTS